MRPNNFIACPRLLCVTAVIMLALLACISASGCYKKHDELRWSCIDVSTMPTPADAHLLTVNATNHCLIDTGLKQSAGKLLDFLRSKKCRNIQSVIITHGHRDHYGGLIPLLNSGITVGCVFFNPPDKCLITNELWGCSVEEIAEIFAVCRKNNIPVKPIQPNTAWNLGDNTRLNVICAFNGLDTPVGRTDINDTSAILMLAHRNIKILFAADLNRAMGDFLTTNAPALLRADILKFPHHGTEGFPNDGFIEAVHAGTFVVPASKELWLSERSARARRLTKDLKVYVNGIDGDITILSDGNTFRVYREKR